MVIQKRESGRFRLLCLLSCLFILSAGVFAAEGGAGSLTLCYSHEGVEFRIYQVAESSGTGGCIYTESYKGCQIKLPQDGDFTGSWQEAAKALTAYTTDHNISADRSGTTADGSVTFSGLEAGLYLVIGAPTVSENTTYTPTLFLVYVDGAVTAYVKADISSPDPGPDGPDIPQTGQLWWPVLVLTICGAGLIAVWLLRRKSGECEDA